MIRRHRSSRSSGVAFAAVAGLSALAPGGCNNVLDVGQFQVKATAGAIGCTTNRECIAAQGPNFICRKEDLSCVSLTSDNCPTVYGNYEEDSTIFFGTVFPLSGTNATTGKALQNSVELGARELDILNGLPPVTGATERRYIALVQCDDASNNDKAVAAATHLVADLHVPVLIGTNATGVTLKMATEVTIKNGVFMISPTATGRDLTTLDDQGLFWRTSPSSDLQIEALAQLMPYVEADLRASLALPTEAKISVAAAVKSDGFGTGLAKGLVESDLFTFNGLPGTSEANRPYFLSSEYGNPDSTASTPDYDGTAAQLLAARPHVIFMFGTNEVINELLPRLEDNWPTAAPYRPLYLFANSGYKADLWQAIAQRDPLGVGLRRRVLGVTYGSTDRNYDVFRISYNSTFKDGSSPDVLSTSNAYDTFYLMAYAAYAAYAAGAPTLTGRSVADAMGRLVTGMPANVGPGDSNQVLSLLKAQQSVDLVGASGPLNFDLSTGEAPSDIQIWCVKLANGVPDKQGTYAGPKLSADTSTLVGSAPGSAFDYATLKTSCNF
jgi:hypothetical protein